MTDNYQQCRKLEEEIKRQRIQGVLHFVGGLGWYVCVKKTDFPKIRNISWVQQFPERKIPAVGTGFGVRCPDMKRTHNLYS